MKKINKFYIFDKKKKKDIYNHIDCNFFCKMWNFEYKVCCNYKNNEMINDIWWARCVKINTKKTKCVRLVTDNEYIYV